MNPATSPANCAVEDRPAELASNTANEQRRIRRGMRVDPKAWVKDTGRALSPALLRGAMLITGGFCLGWGAFRFWNN